MSESEPTKDGEEIKRKLDAFIQGGKLQDIFKDQERLAIVKLQRYGNSLVLPYEDAVKFIQTLHKAQEIEVDYNDKISFPEKTELLDVGFKVIDAVKFNRAKVANFLKIDGNALETYLNNSEELPF